MAEHTVSIDGPARWQAWRQKSGNGWVVLAILIAALISIPVLVVAGHVFVPAPEIWSHLVDTVLPRYLLNTLYLAIGVGAGVLVIGVGTAWLVTMCQFPGRRLFEWSLLLPFAVPAYVIAYTYTGLLDFAGPVQTGLREVFGWDSRLDYWFPQIRSLGGAVTMMSLVLYPYVYLLSRAAFLEQSVCALEVSRTLGSSPWRSFWTVALPLARPSIIAGLALALMETLNDLGTVQFFAVDTFTTGIYRTWLNLGEPVAAAQLAAILMVFVLALILLERGTRGAAGFHHATQVYRPLPRYVLRGKQAIFATTACALPIFLGFLAPAAVLAKWAAETRGWLDPAFLRLSLNSFTLAAATGLIAVLLAVLLAYGQRLRPGRLNIVASRIAAMGYAIPGAVIAVGVLLPFAWVDQKLDFMTRSLFGVSIGLVLSGTLAALIFAYLVRFFAISLNTVEAGLARVTRNMEGAARTLGLGPGATLRRVHLPIVRASLLAAGLLVFVDVLKELPATLIIRPFNFETLATRVYELAVDEQLQEASSAALTIMLVGIIPVIVLSRAIARSRPGSAAADPGETADAA